MQLESCTVIAAGILSSITREKVRNSGWLNKEGAFAIGADVYQVGSVE